MSADDSLRAFGAQRPPMRGRYLARNPLLWTVLKLTETALRLAPIRRRPAPTGPTAILVCQWAHLGDVIATLPVLVRLRQTYPRAKIGMVIGSWARPLIENSGLVDAIYTVDHWALNRKKVSYPAKIAQYLSDLIPAARAIRADGYDVALDVYPYFPSAGWLLWLARIPSRIGYDSAGLGPLYTQALSWRFDGRHMADHHADVLRLLSPSTPASLAPFHPRPIGPSPVDGSGDYVVIHAGAGSSRREWPIARWIEVAQRLSAQSRVVLTGAGAREAEAAAAIAAAVPGAIDLCGRLSWEELTRVVAGARLLIGLDSAASHLAAGLSIPVVAVTSGRTEVDLWRPKSERSRVLTHPVACAPCFRTRGCAAMACVRGVTVDEVLLAAAELRKPVSPAWTPPSPASEARSAAPAGPAAARGPAPPP